MVNSIEELIESRRSLFEQLERNKARGLLELLADLYPDTAHFIYELLQNAEDMRASNVYFELKDDGLLFKHNGTKRDFNLGDIDAITNARNNLEKRNDETAIGKFGVGFKAVYAYTTTPEIHSGSYHFKIEKFIVPNLNVEPRDTVDEYGVSWTIFYLPFDHPSKEPTKAVQEITDGLFSLNDYALLFLRHIRTITYRLPDDSFGCIKSTDISDHIIAVDIKKANTSETIENEWLRFHRLESFVDERGNKKELNIGVAFRVIKNRAGKRIAVPIEDDSGKVCIYFPAVKEKSGLRFSINGPFDPTPARDGIKENNEHNNHLIYRIGQLLVDSLETIKNMGMMDYNFMSCLPNSKDESPEPYNVFGNIIRNAFETGEYFPAKDGSYVGADRAIVSSQNNDIIELFTPETFDLLLEEPFKWLLIPPTNSYAYRFLKDFSIWYSDDLLFETIEKSTDKFENFIQLQGTMWVAKFFKYLNNISINDNVLNIMKRCKILKDKSGVYHDSTDIYLLGTSVDIDEADVNLIDRTDYLILGTDNMYHTDALSFISNELGVKSYDRKTILEKYVNRIQKAFDDAPDADSLDEYFKELLELAKYIDSHQDSYNTLDSYEIFIYGTDKIMLGGVENYFDGFPYYNSKGRSRFARLEYNPATAYRTLYLYPFVEYYIEHYSINDYNIVYAVAKKCGLQSGLRGYWSNIFEHPLFHKALSTHHYDRYTGYGESNDFNVIGLVELLAIKSPQISKTIWEFICNLQYPGIYSEGTYKYARDYAMAKYSPNGTTYVNKCDSTMVYHLKQQEWVPDKNNVLHKPCDIKLEDIRSGFKKILDDGLSWTVVEALVFGSAIDAKNAKMQQIKDLFAQADNLGYKVVSKSEWDEFQSWKENKSNQ